jgi:ribonuclease HII
MVLIAGVDEAGRGCVIGPLIIAGVVFEEKKLPQLVKLGVTDSKKLSSKKRENLEKEIKKLAIDYKYYELVPRIIDKVVFRSVPLRRLNYLETMAMAKIIRDLRPDKAYVDPADVIADRCVDQIARVLPFKINIICEPKADIKYKVTGAASILAKVKRDKIISELREKYGDFNSGYPSDKKTRGFIKTWFKDHTECPPFIRESWKTVQNIRKTVTLTQQ